MCKNNRAVQRAPMGGMDKLGKENLTSLFKHGIKIFVKPLKTITAKGGDMSFFKSKKLECRWLPLSVRSGGFVMGPKTANGISVFGGADGY